MDNYLIFILPTVFFLLGMLVGYSMNSKNRRKQQSSKEKFSKENMLELLDKVERSLPELLFKNADNIRTMYIDYHKPYVSRIWFIDKELGCRVFLHKIEPCTESKEALYHPHPWDSAISIIQGKYEMGVGHSETNEIPKTDCKLILGPGTRYSMTEKDGWHYVSPIDEPVYTLMITPNELNGRIAPVEPNKQFRKLMREEISDSITVFSHSSKWMRRYFHVEGGGWGRVNKLVDLICKNNS